jgi:RNA-directed DNA polymerase
MSLFTLENVFRQYLACRRNKRNTINALRFEARQEMELLKLQEALADRSYTPGRSVCFFVQRPKLREVFAADFRDRVVHHILVSHLEKIWEPIFIHDSYACRKGKGVHAAVDRLQLFMRQATANGTRRAFALQLDIRNYFMTIDKPRLLGMLKAKLRGNTAEDIEAKWLAALLVRHDCTQAPIIKGDPRLVEKLPAHKTLFNAPEGKGLPIGNLNSQFFANVYLNALDQFVKHELKCRWYLRYCDDFVLVSENAEQLEDWKCRIEPFLNDTLLLKLNPMRERLTPVADGVDFLGYIVRPTHLLIRRRVIGHLREKLALARHVLMQDDGALTLFNFHEPALDLLQAQLASYFGHFKPAASFKLVQEILASNAWLKQFLRFDGLTLRRRDKQLSDARTVLGQYRHWCAEFGEDEVWIQVGYFIERLQWPPRRLKASGGAKRKFRATSRGLVEGFPLSHLAFRVAQTLGKGRSFLLVGQKGGEAGRIEARRPVRRWVANSASCGEVASRLNSPITSKR